MSNVHYGFHTPTNLQFGEGCIQDIPEYLSQRGLDKVLVVTDSNLVHTGIPGKITHMLKEKGIDYLLFDEVKENPTEDNVHAGRDLIVDENCNAVLAVGGGSSIDAAKAMSMLSVQGGLITEYEYGLKPITKKGPAIILVPTTSGTGSETTFWSVITDQKTHRKFDVGSPLMAAESSFVDPELTYSLPPMITAATGMDAMCHAMESLVTKNNWSGGRALAKEAIQLISDNLLTVFNTPGDVEARRAVMMGSMIAGMSFSNSGLGAVHGLTAPLGGHFGVPHGVANAILLPIVMEFNLSAAEEGYADAARQMGCAEASGKAAVQRILEMNKVMNIPRLSKYNVTEESLELLAEDALGMNSNCNSNPVAVSLEDAVALYRKAL